MTGEADPAAPAARSRAPRCWSPRRGGTPTQLADLLAHELENNPDGQTQFGPEGEPLDALSNPFAVIEDRSHKGFVLVADGGANDVLRVEREGDVETFFVPPTVNTGACEGLPNNDENTVGCDAVPTGLAYSPDQKKIYVSALTAEVPGEGRVYVVDAKTGKLHARDQGLQRPDGRRRSSGSGAVFVSELLEGLPAGEPGPDFDPSTVGQIVKVRPDGARSASQVTDAGRPGRRARPALLHGVVGGRAVPRRHRSRPGGRGGRRVVRVDQRRRATPAAAGPAAWATR